MIEEKTTGCHSTSVVFGFARMPRSAINFGSRSLPIGVEIFGIGRHFYRQNLSASCSAAEVSLGSNPTLPIFGFSPPPDISTTVIVLGHQQLK
jgi:hypothetical protein